MTDSVIGTDGDHFWGRVRAALSVLSPANRERAPAYGQSAITRYIDKKPKLGARIEEELEQGWANAAQARVSMSLLVIEIDRMSEHFTAYGRMGNDDCLRSVMQTIANALPRDEDMCLRMGSHTFVVALPDVPVLQAKASAKKIAHAIRKLGLAHKESHAGIVTVSMGLAVINPGGAYDKKFFEAAAGALKKAQRKGLGRLHSVDLRPAQERRRKKLAA